MDVLSERKVCQFSDMEKIWETKEYRLLPRAILQYLRQDERISDGEHLCWLYMLDMAYFEKEWVFKRSREEIANDLRKKSRTISRYLKKLEECGYIELRHQSGDVTVYSVRFPKKAIEKILIEVPDRKKAVSSKRVSSARHSEPLISKVSGDDPITVTGLLPNVTRGHDKNGRYTINNTMLTNNNTMNFDEPQCRHIENPVVNDGQLEEENKDQITETNRQRIAKLNEQLANEVDRVKRYNLMRLRNALEAKNTVIELKVTQQHKQQQQRAVLEAEKDHYSKDASYMARKPGVRKFSDFQLRRIQHSLLKMERMNNKLVNEVVYEVRFGSLCEAREGKRDIAIDHAINIALKLIRMGRWSTPVGILKKFPIKQKIGE